MLKKLALLTCVLLIGAAPAPPPAIFIPVQLAPSLGGPQSGRIIVFVKRLEDPAKPDAKVDFNPFSPSAASIAAREVDGLKTGIPALVDGETDAVPGAMSKLSPGTYEMQAVLDRDHDYAYRGRAEGDLVSKVVVVTLPASMPVLVLDSEVPPADLAARLARRPAEVRESLTKLKSIDFQSNALTAFRGSPTLIKGWVALPPGYDGKARFPTVYSSGGFGSSLISAKLNAATIAAAMASGRAPPMIWVYLDHSGATGVNEFADSANNGPWGKALTTELIPWLEKQYRMDARASGRFLIGHSSGGWSSLWLQVRYPKVFGGSWPTSPDPSDFHDFLNVDIYRSDANLYRGANGAPIPFIREPDKAVVALEDYARAEAVLGGYGGQMASFEWVFSPRGADGLPAPLFDRSTGRIDPAVASYWRENYDIAHIISRDWPALKQDLDGKIHLTVGGADTFYLDHPARRLEAVMKAVGAKTDFRFVTGKGHFDLYVRDGNDNALTEDIAWEMYAVARPGLKRPLGGGTR